MSNDYTLGRQSLAKELYNIMMAHYSDYEPSHSFSYEEGAEWLDSILCEIFDYVKQEKNQAD